MMISVVSEIKTLTKSTKSLKTKGPKIVGPNTTQGGLCTQGKTH